MVSKEWYLSRTKKVAGTRGTLISLAKTAPNGGIDATQIDRLITTVLKVLNYGGINQPPEKHQCKDNTRAKKYFGL